MTPAAVTAHLCPAFDDITGNRIDDYPALSNYLRDLYQVPGVRGTVVMDHIKRHYYYSRHMINPTRVVPRGPRQDFDSPHDRARFGQRHPAPV